MCKNNLFADCGKYLQITKAAKTEEYLDKIGNKNNTYMHAHRNININMNEDNSFTDIVEKICRKNIHHKHLLRWLERHKLSYIIY